MMIGAKTGAAMTAAFGVILVLALPGCGSSDDGNEPSGPPPSGEQPNNNNGIQLPEVPAGSWGVNALVNGTQVQYGDADARRRGTEAWVASPQSSAQNVGSFRLKIPGDSSKTVPVLAPGDYGCQNVELIMDDALYFVKSGTACTLKIEASDAKAIKGAIQDVTLVNAAGASATFSARFTAEVRKALRPAPPKE